MCYVYVVIDSTLVLFICCYCKLPVINHEVSGVNLRESLCANNVEGNEFQGVLHMSALNDQESSRKRKSYDMESKIKEVTISG